MTTKAQSKSKSKTAAKPESKTASAAPEPSGPETAESEPAIPAPDHTDQTQFQGENDPAMQLADQPGGPGDEHD